MSTTADNPKLSWSQPQCEPCWIERRAVRDGDRIVSVPLPARMATPALEKCAWCGCPTIFGVYVRQNPATVPYPSVEHA